MHGRWGARVHQYADQAQLRWWVIYDYQELHNTDILNRMARDQGSESVLRNLRQSAINSIERFLIEDMVEILNKRFAAPAPRMVGIPVLPCEGVPKEGIFLLPIANYYEKLGDSKEYPHINQYLDDHMSIMGQCKVCGGGIVRVRYDATALGSRSINPPSDRLLTRFPDIISVECPGCRGSGFQIR